MGIAVRVVVVTAARTGLGVGAVVMVANVVRRHDGKGREDGQLGRAFSVRSRWRVMRIRV